MSGQIPAAPQQQQLELQALSSALPAAAHQQEEAALQQPVLALLSSGLPPIVLGTFQGDMQRARIILEAAGFLVPLDISSSLLPPGLAPSPIEQRAEHAGLWSNPAAAVAAAQVDIHSSADEAGGAHRPASTANAHARQAANEGVIC